jgi:hypothetical protein
MLAIESNASYLSVTKARSQAAGYFFLTNTRQATHTSHKANDLLYYVLLTSSLECQRKMSQNGPYGERFSIRAVGEHK